MIDVATCAVRLKAIFAWCLHDHHVTDDQWTRWAEQVLGLLPRSGSYVTYRTVSALDEDADTPPPPVTIEELADALEEVLAYRSHHDRACTSIECDEHVVPSGYLAITSARALLARVRGAK